MKTLLCFLLALPAFGATTTVTLPIHGPDDMLVNGNVLIRISAPCRSGSSYVVDKTINVKVTAGAFSVALVPNDTCSPSGYVGTQCPDCRTSYTVVWLPTGGTTRTQTWVVPTSSSPVTVDSVIVSTTPVPAVPQINPSQIAQGGAAQSQAMCWSGTSWGPGSCGGSGGGGGGSGTVSTYMSGLIVGPEYPHERQ